ncbi:MAG TPA: prepilin-type N-terminal cleavage/methylation domain-containing protein [Candidatus Saccharimonadales bacterium]|jgi:type IV pilus assembly protein PilA|nr:prepilin-type N-terminal cleavage/methylation domain-containing protein [Candidatus Saccharimonadales bacterium]
MRKQQSGFSLIEMLIVVVIILIVAAIAIPNLLRSRMAANESASSSTVRTLTSSAVVYSTSYPQNGFPASLANLGGASPCTPGPVTACLSDQALACAAQPCVRESYQYSLTGIGAGAPAPNTDFVLFSTAVSPSAGSKDYCVTQESVIRFQNIATPPTGAFTTVSACAALSPL